MKTPLLRFKHYKGPWKRCRLETLLDFKNGINATKEQYGKGIKFINVLDILDNDYITYDRIIGLVNVDQVTIEKNLVEYGDILFQRSSETPDDVGRANVYLDRERKATFGGFVIRGKQIGEYDPQFLNFLLGTRSARTEIIKRSGGSTRFNVGQEVLKAVEISLPTLAEQQKIASFLAAVDTKIQQLTKKKELLEQYKKAVMQKIFTQEIRFKDEKGKNYPKWIFEKLGRLTYKVGKRNKERIQYPIYSINNKQGFVPQSDQFDGMDSNIRGYDISMYKIIHRNTFAYNPARINVGSIGYSGDLNEILVSSLYVCFKTQESLCDEYLSHYVRSFDFNKSVLRNVEGGVRQYLFYENLSSIKIPRPSLQEQQRIARFLTSIEKKIKEVTSRIDLMHAFKQGLFQQMFV